MAAPASRRPWGGCEAAPSYAQVVAQRGQPLLADPRHLVELVDRAEAAVLRPVVDDLLGRGGPDAIERAELLGGCRVEIDRRGGLTGCGGLSRQRGPDRPRGRRPARDDDLPAVLDLGGEVQGVEVGLARG